MSLTTVYGSKDQVPTGYLPLLLATFTFGDASVLRLCTNPLSVAEGGADYGVQYSGNNYLGRLSQEDIGRIQSVSPQGIMLIPSVTLSIADADGYIYTNYENAAGKGFKGSALVMDLVLYDPIGKAFSSDSIRKFTGVCELPKRTRLSTIVQINSLQNPQRTTLPSVHVQPRCWKNFPTTATERQAAADDRSSQWWDCGYSPDASGGNARGNSGTPFTDCDKLKSSCIARGMYNMDNAGSPRITRRFGGIQWQGPSDFKGKSFVEGKTLVGYNNTNAARYNDLVTMVYGTQWVDVEVMEPLGDPNSTRFEGVICVGQTQKIVEVVCNGVTIPKQNSSDKLFTWYQITTGDRTGAFTGDALYNSLGDPYGSMCMIEVVIPTALGTSSSIPQCRAWIDGAIIPTPDSNDTSSTGQAAWPRVFTYNPVWQLLDIMTWSNFTYSQIDMATWRTAATYCNVSVNYTANNGTTQAHPRFVGSGAIKGKRSAADIIQGWLNNFNGILVPNDDGSALQLFIRQTLADQQGSPVSGSNYNSAISSHNALGSAVNGYAAYDFNESNIIASTLETLPLSSSESGNRIGIVFQDENNAYTVDSVAQIDSFAIGKSGNQEIPNGYTIDGICNFDQATRRINTQFGQLFRGNPRGDAGGTIRYQFRASTGALHLRVGHIVRFTWQQDNISNQLFRVDEIGYSQNAESVSLVISWHSDGWYQDNYGTAADPFYHDPRKDVPIRDPYAWAPFGEVNIGDAMYGNEFSSFAVLPSYVTQADGSAVCDLTVYGRPPANVPGSADPPQVPIQGLTASTGGFFVPGDYDIRLASIDAAGKWSTLSQRIPVTVPAGTNTNTITINNITWPALATGGAAFAATNELLLYSDGALGTFASSITLDDLPAPNIGPLDVKFDHFLTRVKKIVHGGVYGGVLNAVGTNTAQIANFGVSAVDQFKDHILSVYGLATPGAAVPIFNTNITGSSVDGSNNLNLATSLTLPVNAGDVVVIRAKSSSITSTTIGDAAFVNASAAAGIPAGEQGLLLMIIAGTGEGQVFRVLSNTSTVYTIDGAWWVTPDVSSIFIIVEANWQYEKTSETLRSSTPLPLNPIKTGEVLINNPNGGSYFVQVITEDVADNSGPDYYAPFREVYLFGSGGSGAAQSIQIAY